MNETSKCYTFRNARGDFDRFLRGDGIDIGCGHDPLRIEHGAVGTWDVQDGDAQIMPGVVDGSFDFVYSSHCLEHMRDVEETLFHWTRILRPGGYLYIVVPDYILYEKLTWPSLFNRDHKQSFSPLITRQQTQRPNHWHIEHDLKPLAAQLGLNVLRVTLEDHHFNYNAGAFDQTAYNGLAQLCIVAEKRLQR